MNYVQKNRNTILLISAGVVLITAFIIWAMQNKEYTSDDVMANVYPISLNVGDSLNFEDSSPFGEKRKWIFGDGYETAQKKGTHIYSKAGFYPVTLIIDDKFNKTFNVLVAQGASKVDEPTPSIIEAPIQARQFENVLFRAISDDAKMFTWRFGETGNIDSKDQVATYAYKTPGSYVVTLYTDKDSDPIIHQINILPSYPALEEELDSTAPTQEEVFSKINDDFRKHLQHIANGDNFNYHYNYLKNTYLCRKDNISVTVNDKNNSFYNYCMGLRFDKSNIIQEAKTTVDTEQNCVTKVEVKQSKQ